VLFVDAREAHFRASAAQMARSTSSAWRCAARRSDRGKRFLRNVPISRDTIAPIRDSAHNSSGCYADGRSLTSRWTIFGPVDRDRIAFSAWSRTIKKDEREILKWVYARARNADGGATTRTARKAFAARSILQRSAHWRKTNDFRTVFNSF